MKMIEWIFKTYFKPILLWLAAMTIIFLKENAKKLSEFKFSLIMTFWQEHWLLLVILLVIVLITTFVIQRIIIIKKKNRRVDAPVFGFARTSNDKILTEQYRKFNVFWRVETLNGNIHVGYSAMCPNCNTNLNEKITFWNKFRWTCPNCGFTIKQKRSMYTIRERVEQIADGERNRLMQ